MKKSFWSYFFVVVQFTSIFYLLSDGINYSISVALFLEGLGVVLGLWSVWVMHKSVLTVFPEPHLSIQLITDGPYRFIRHPMYTSLFLVLVPAVAVNFSNFRLIVLIIFGINQILKIYFEEKLLLQRLDNYREYMKFTWRLIPYIY